jgi:hypothetical protein
VTAAEFRQIALSFPEAIESAHMHHPDFRVGGKIFATLGYPADGWAMVKLSSEKQRHFVRSDPDSFRLVKGAWGRRGGTNVDLAQAKAGRVREAVAEAWRNVAPKRLTSAPR